jgi:hypothetical protein
MKSAVINVVHSATTYPKVYCGDLFFLSNGRRTLLLPTVASEYAACFFRLCRKNIMYLVFEYTFKYRVRMAHMSLHYLYNQKIIFLHMDVKERTCLLLYKER